MIKNGVKMNNIYGITQYSDNRAEEDVYTVGSDGNIPIVLFVLAASNFNNAVERYLSVHSYTKLAQNSVKELYAQNPNLQEEVKKIADIFDERDPESQRKMIEHAMKHGMTPFEGFNERDERSVAQIIKEYPRDAILDFHIYASKIATYMVMRTPTFDTGREGVPQACSMAYIAFHSRTEFELANKAVDNAFVYLVNEVVRIMKIRGIDVNEEKMTLSMPAYKAISFRRNMYPGF